MTTAANRINTSTVQKRRPEGGTGSRPVALGPGEPI
jgi:hypothetical protein